MRKNEERLKKQEAKSIPYTSTTNSIQEEWGNYQWYNEIEREKKIITYDGLQKVFENIRLCQNSDPRQVILITGERGVGKELVAKAIHRDSDRKDKLFVAMNCAAIPKELLESELFGHVKGAFSGAIKNKPGRFLEADKGVLFLDEIGNISLETQAKLLRVIEDRKVVKVGDDYKNAKDIDVKVIVATNKDLLSEIKEGRFKADLHDRIKGFPIHIPPLRERILDIPVLVKNFVFVEDENGRTKKGISSLQFELLFFCICWPWPGNVRELKSFIGFCHNKCDSRGVLGIKHAKGFFGDDPSSPIYHYRLFLDYMVKHAPSELQKFAHWKTKKLNKQHGRVSLYLGEETEYEEIKLDEIPEPGRPSRNRVVELSRIVDHDNFLQKIRNRQELSPQEEELKRCLNEPKKHENYVDRIYGLKYLFERNFISWHAELFPLQKEMVDIYSLPYKQAKIEFKYEYSKRTLERNNGNKTKTVKEMSISDETLRKNLKKFNL